MTTTKYIIFIWNILILTCSLQILQKGKDLLIKNIFLSLSISYLIVISSSSSSYLQPPNISEYLYQSIIYISVLQAIFTNNYQLRLVSIVLGNGFLAIISVFYYSHLKDILNQQYLAIMIFISIIGCFSLIYVDRLIIKIFQNDKSHNIIRRKTFHLIPIILFPIMDHINQQLLHIILVGSFYIIINLELIRVSSALHIQDNSYPFQLIFKNLRRILNEVFKWMSQFNNTRQPNFWFTHLFLYLTIILSYILYSQNYKQNIGLIIVLADGAAALVGSRYGKIFIFKKKTFQGMISFVIVMVVCQLFILGLWAQSYNIWKIFMLSLFTAICQLFSGDLDNIMCVWVFITLDYLLNSY